MKSAHTKRALLEPTSIDRTASGERRFLDDLARARVAWSQALSLPQQQAVAAALEAAAIGVDECVHEAATVTELPATQYRLETIRNVVRQSTTSVAPGAFERFILGHTALRYEEQLSIAPVSPVVKRLTCSGVARFADERTILDLAENRFLALCKMATLRRFAAGQFDWEMSGLPRSWFPRVRPVSALIRLVSLVAFRWRGFRPAFVCHMPVTKPLYALRERDALKAYHRMAQSMKLQPEVKGLIAAAWLHAPVTFEVSPHLAWLNKVFAEHGAVIATIGPATPDCGVLVGSAERQRAFTEGRFKPAIGLIVWNRADMLAWAADHPELDH
jgi:hypothetical protein